MKSSLVLRSSLAPRHSLINYSNYLYVRHKHNNYPVSSQIARSDDPFRITITSRLSASRHVTSRDVTSYRDTR